MPSSAGSAPASESVWARAAAVCVRETNRIPEVILAEALTAFNISRRRLSNERKPQMTTWATKLQFTSPPAFSVVWHTHNVSARGSWLVAEERSRSIDYEAALRASPDAKQIHGQNCFRTPSVKP